MYKSTARKSPSLIGVDEMPSVNDRYYQSVSFNNDELPELEDWEVGETYEIKIKAKLRRRNEGMDKDVSGCFDIVMVEGLDKARKLSKEQKKIKDLLE